MSDSEPESGPDLTLFMKILIFQNFDFMIPTRWCIQSSAVKIKFFDLITPFESQMPTNLGKNTDTPNEFTDSENFSPNGVAQMISMFATNTAKHLGSILL